MNSGLIAALMGALLRALSPEVIRAAIDSFLDKIEDAIAKSPTKVDDTLIQPIITSLRAAINVPDGEK